MNCLSLMISIPLISSFAGVTIDSPKIALNGVPQRLVLRCENDQAHVASIEGLGDFPIKDGFIILDKTRIPDPLRVTVAGQTEELELSHIPGILSILPPLLAIVFAFILKDVFVSLFLGIYVGVLFLSGFNPLVAFYNVFNDKFVGALSDSAHIKILMFTLGMAAFIGLLRKSGGLVDLIDKMKATISTPRSGMVATWFSGLVIFFDDYANSLLVGNMLRPLTDKLRISREKLSYIVDATAAPIASLAISTWIGTEISLMEDAYHGIDPAVSGMSLFIGTMPFRFYSIFTIFFVFFICFLNRDFGPMRKAERRARTTGALHAENATPMQDDEAEEFARGMKAGKWYGAAIPLLGMILFIVSFIYLSGAKAVGFDKPIKDILDSAATSSSLMFGPIFGIALFYLIGFKLFTLNEFVMTLIQGAKTVLIAVFILTLAWSIGLVCKELETATFLISLFGETITPMLLPAITFILSAITAFATGTSWGTMAIMFPIIVPLVHHVLEIHGISPELSHRILYGTMGSILAGACLGDHSSPISDTTLFSSMASGADHIDHVKTQIPYALSVGAISLLLGYIPIALGIHWSISLILGIGACFCVVRFLGQKNEV